MSNPDPIYINKCGLIEVISNLDQIYINNLPYGNFGAEGLIENDIAVVYDIVDIL